MKTALVYDRVNKWGGAERVLLTLHEIFPDAPLYTSVYSPQDAPWAKVFPQIKTSFLQRIPGAQRNHEKLAALMPIAFESFDFSDFDLVISITSEAAKGIITGPKTRHICYCLTPTRYLWSGYGEYFHGSMSKVITKPIINYLRKWDKTAARRPDMMVAISQAVQDRIKKYYHRDSTVVYPPVDIGNFSLNSKSPDSSFYLLVSRLVPYKRVDLAIEAFNRIKTPLVIVGTGSEERKLKKMAKENIKFLGQLTDRQLSGYYEKCAALIFPQEEDFGLVAVEAQAKGTPVIAFHKGGAVESVLEGKTGIFFDKQDVESLVSAIKTFKKMKFKPQECQKNAERFDKKRFKKEFLALCE
jgi:glycosyltransferase involved in cell wall biosynthesis